jgi:outer membrane lipoprotein carrier protein
MKIADALGQTTRLEFSNVVSNAAVAADAFHFVPPKGADILDN